MNNSQGEQADEPDEKLAQLRETRRKLGWRYDPHKTTPPDPHQLRTEADEAPDRRTSMAAHPLYVVSPTRRTTHGRVQTDWAYVTSYALTIGLLLLCSLLAFWAS
ncbi:MAG: hypothetical protein KDD89_01320 [Anaerolineales bacterium]|nr:hypothetical protein [Anaerolineales bacterium]